MADRIKKITGREILNAKGSPTVEAELVTENGFVAVASVPSGTSTGTYEAYALYDGGTRYDGKGTRKACANINGAINDLLKGKTLENQEALDTMMTDLDGTSNKSNLGANAILAVSVAIAKARALSQGKQTFETLTDAKTYKIPHVIATVIAGGAFGLSGLEFEDYLYILHGFDFFSDQLEAIVRLRKQLGKNLEKMFGTVPEDGGALAAPLHSSDEAFDIMLQTAKECGYEKQVDLGIDAAISEQFDQEKKNYHVQAGMTSEELCAYYVSLATKYPLTYLEDCFDENDFDGFELLGKALPNVQNVGDDLFASNIKRLEAYHKVANGLLLKINQIGTVSEAIAAANYAKNHGLDVTVSLRSGETTDDFIADLSVALSTRQIKLGSPVRAERNMKYNRLQYIATVLGV
ncbi:MAG: phosphopyruvate hydratase [Sphaerochaetaceae bacterium]|nr:phosphopyruvate hydratase [Sphaerochaetaceae bacterium]